MSNRLGIACVLAVVIGGSLLATVCSGASVNLNGFRASRSGSTWTIDAVP